MKLNRLSIVVLLAASCSLWANDLGQYGQVFPIIEQDIREVFLARLSEMARTGALARHEETMKERVKEHLLHPQRLHLTKGSASRSFLVDPSITLRQDLRLPDGRLIAASGTRINPFDYHALRKTLVFFDAEDPLQMAWIKKNRTTLGVHKLILTGGSIQDAAEALGQVYFDVQGALTGHFHIEHVPALVKQEGRSWRVQEIGGIL